MKYIRMRTIWMLLLWILLNACDCSTEWVTITKSEDSNNTPKKNKLIKNKTMEIRNYSVKEILFEMDRDICNKGYFYFDPDNVNRDYIGGKIHVFWDSSSYLIVFESIGFSYGARAVISELFWFGQGENIPEPENNDNSNYNVVDISSYDNLVSLFGEDLTQRKDEKDVLNLNQKTVEIPSSNLIIGYLKKNVPEYLINYIGPTEVMRYVVDHYPEIVFLEESDIKNKLNIDMERKLMVSNWHHEFFDCPDGIPPSKNASLQRIAYAIEKKDSSLFEKDDKGNINWRYWWESY